ncbi:MAG: radical SAM protein [Patescibacteria group bacterium]
MSEVDVLLVLPPMYQSGRIPDYNPKEPMGLMYLAGELRQNGYSVEILDADLLALTVGETLRRILEKRARVIGFSVMQRALPSVKMLVEGLDDVKPRSHISCGGFTATLSARYILQSIPQVDSIVLGEGELTFTNLVSQLLEGKTWQETTGIAYRHDGVVIVNPPGHKPDLDSLTRPTRELLPVCLEKTNYATVLASRGCYGVCTFCCNCSFERCSLGPNWRGRKPGDVVDELEAIHRDHGVRVFKFNDPNLFGPGSEGRQHVVEICQDIIRRGLGGLHLMAFCRSNDIDEEIVRLMKKAGFERLLIGIETISADALRLFRKGETPETVRRTIQILRESDIDLVPGFMIFNPYTTIETLKQDLAFLHEYGHTPTLAKALRVFDGIPLQGMLESEGRLVWRNPIEGYHEYLVSPDVAAIYMALKTVAVEWLDTFKKAYQGELWGIKKAPSFKERQGFDILNRLTFNLESRLLTAFITWMESGFTLQDIVGLMTDTRRRLRYLEDFTLMASDENQPVLSSQILSSRELAGKIHTILTHKVYRTFPEQYRWKDD